MVDTELQERMKSTHFGNFRVVGGGKSFALTNTHESTIDGRGSVTQKQRGKNMVVQKQRAICRGSNRMVESKRSFFFFSMKSFLRDCYLRVICP